jgi:hypothetical protein
VLDGLEPMQASVIIHGAAPAADTPVSRGAELRPVPLEAFPADWEKHGRAAEPIRNALILAEGKPDRVGRFRRTRDREPGQARARGGRRGAGNVHRRRHGGGLRDRAIAVPFHSAFNTVSTCIASNGKMMARLRLGPHGRRGERRVRPCAVTGSRQMPSLLIKNKNNNKINGAPINTSANADGDALTERIWRRSLSAVDEVLVGRTEN